ncbi:MAG: winged helix-turn-helix transcriptional regulator [Nanoarchaeota archaeon]|nr:winged helix-turn-helix transcriptional regulator [Nanoarchaeota archaeon]
MDEFSTWNNRKTQENGIKQNLQFLGSGKKIKMKNKTEGKILETLRKGEELDSIVIADKIGLTYNTTAKHLKKMTEERVIERKAEGKDGMVYSDGKKHWTYHYSIRE